MNTKHKRNKFALNEYFGFFSKPRSSGIRIRGGLGVLFGGRCRHQSVLQLLRRIKTCFSRGQDINHFSILSQICLFFYCLCHHRHDTIFKSNIRWQAVFSLIWSFQLSTFEVVYLSIYLPTK